MKQLQLILTVPDGADPAEFRATVLRACAAFGVEAEVPTPPASRGTGVPTWETLVRQVDEARDASAHCASWTPDDDDREYNDLQEISRAKKAALLATLRTLSAAAEQRGQWLREVLECIGYDAAELHEAPWYVRLVRDTLAAAAETITELRAAAEQGERDREDAERWRGLFGCDRVRVLGTGGTNHIGVEFWVRFPLDPAVSESTGASRVTLAEFADRAARQPRQEGDR